MRVLITGSTGFVGSHILETILQDTSLTPIAACRNKENLLRGFSGEIREGDLRDPEYIQSIVKEVDVICHAAAWTSLWNHKHQSQINFLNPSLALIEAAKNAGVKHFIFPSTTSAASPNSSSDTLALGIPKKFWPHLCNVIAIEKHLREAANVNFSTTTLRLGIFVGKRYGLGILPILLPRLKTHLVPWVAGGNTHIPLIDGRDIGLAFLRTIKANLPAHHHGFNIVGSEQPTVKQLVTFIHNKYHYPKPHFSVPFTIAYPFAWLMEILNPVVPWEPLVTRSIIHLLEETHTDNQKAQKLLGYEPQIHWKEAVQEQIDELHTRQKSAMSLAVKD